jgi:hypothetical protein
VCAIKKCANLSVRNASPTTHRLQVVLFLLLAKRRSWGCRNHPIQNTRNGTCRIPHAPQCAVRNSLSSSSKTASFQRAIGSNKFHWLFPIQFIFHAVTVAFIATLSIPPFWPSSQGPVVLLQQHTVFRGDGCLDLTSLKNVDEYQGAISPVS